jgi:hypothetical protein
MSDEAAVHGPRKRESLLGFSIAGSEEAGEADWGWVAVGVEDVAIRSENGNSGREGAAGREETAER